MSDDFSFEIMKKIGTISEGKNDWNLELNVVSWGGRPGKYDIRSWAPDHKKMGKGVGLTADEVKSLRDLLNNLNLD